MNSYTTTTYRGFVGRIFVIAALLFMINMGQSASAATVSITAPTSGQTISANQVHISGLATPGASVVISQNDKTLAWTLSDNSGNWSAVINGLSSGSGTLVAKVIEDPQYAFFGSIGGSNLINHLRLSDNVINPGGGSWPITTTDSYFFFRPATNVYSYAFDALNASSIPARFDVTGVSAPDPIAGYPAAPGSSPAAVTNSQGTKMYIVNNGLDNISVVDIATNTHVGTIALGEDGTASLGYDGKIYVAGYSGQIKVINPDTDTVERTITVNCPTGGVGNLLHVAGESYFYAPCAQDAQLRKIDILSGATLSVFDMSAHQSSISTLSMTPDGKKLYSISLYAESDSDKVQVWDLENQTHLATIQLTAKSMFSELSPSGQKMYVSTQGAFDTTNIDIIDTATDAIVGNIDTSSLGIPGSVYYAPPVTAESSVSINVESTTLPGRLPEVGVGFARSQVVGLGIIACMAIVAIIRRRLMPHITSK